MSIDNITVTMYLNTSQYLNVTAYQQSSVPTFSAMTLPTTSVLKASCARPLSTPKQNTLDAAQNTLDGKCGKVYPTSESLTFSRASCFQRRTGPTRICTPRSQSTSSQGNLTTEYPSVYADEPVDGYRIQFSHRPSSNPIPWIEVTPKF